MGKHQNKKQRYSARHDFFCYAERVIINNEGHKASCTLRNYRTAVNALARCLGRRYLSFESVSLLLIQDFEQFLLREGKCRNTSSAYLRSLQALFNRAVNEGLAPERNPFRCVFTGNEKTVKRTLKHGELRSLLHLDTANERLRLAADVCRFSFAACGMPFVDVARLEWRQVMDGYLTYSRQKTNISVTVRLQPEALAILKHYQGRDSRYVFPLLRGDAAADYPLALARYNRALARLGCMAGIRRRLTSYVIRHSWASGTHRLGAPDAVTGRGLAHTNVRTTAVYIASIDDGKLDYYNRRLLNTVF